MGIKETHLINEFGDKKVIRTSELNKEKQILNENTYSHYTIDVEWYLSNGYTELNKARKMIESNGHN